MRTQVKNEEIIGQLLEINDSEGLRHYLMEHSNLPGRMANLKLIATVADFFESNEELSKSWYHTCNQWFTIECDGNSPETCLVLTALESYGCMFNHLDECEQRRIEKNLQNALNDKRWRMREIVTESYKRIGLLSYEKLINIFDPLLSNNPTPLEIRGMLATVAHPQLLVSNEQFAFSQKILEASFDYYLNFDTFKYSKEDKLILKKGLSFAPSVIVSRNPSQGFTYFQELLENDNKELKIIIKSNLQKKRVEMNYPDEVAKLLAIINK